jgi:hypothetical protein
LQVSKRLIIIVLTKAIIMDKESQFFDIDLSKFKMDAPIYTMGIDSSSDYTDNVYCLIMRHDKETTVILSKTISSYAEFIMEVNALSKYFNAQIIK